MALHHITAKELAERLPGRILSFGWPGNIERVDTQGSELVAVDIVRHEGRERVLDLCDPLPADLAGAFDVVLDCGTTEHCADPARVFRNAADALAVGGVVIQELPVTMVNHGFWCVCPLWTVEFYKANRFDVERLDLVCGGDNTFHGSRVVPWPGPVPDAMDLPPNHLTLVVARKTAAGPAVLPRLEPKWQRGELELRVRRLARNLRRAIERIGCGPEKGKV